MTARRYIEVMQAVLLAMSRCSEQQLTSLPTMIRLSMQFGEGQKVSRREILVAMGSKPIDWIP